MQSGFCFVYFRNSVTIRTIVPPKKIVKNTVHFCTVSVTLFLKKAPISFYTTTTMVPF